MRKPVSFVRSANSSTPNMRGVVGAFSGNSYQPQQRRAAHRGCERVRQPGAGMVRENEGGTCFRAVCRPWLRRP